MALPGVKTVTKIYKQEYEFGNVYTSSPIYRLVTEEEYAAAVKMLKDYGVFVPEDTIEMEFDIDT